MRGTNHPSVVRKRKGQIAFAGTAQLNHHGLAVSCEGQEDAGTVLVWVAGRRAPDTELLAPTVGGTELEKRQRESLLSNRQFVSNDRF